MSLQILMTLSEMFTPRRETFKVEHTCLQDTLPWCPARPSAAHRSLTCLVLARATSQRCTTVWGGGKTLTWKKITLICQKSFTKKIKVLFFHECVQFQCQMLKLKWWTFIKHHISKCKNNKKKQNNNNIAPVQTRRLTVTALFLTGTTNDVTPLARPVSNRPT